MGRRRTFVLVVAVGALAGCGGEDGGEAVASTTLVATTLPPSSSTVLTLPPTTAAFPPAPQPTPEAAASALIGAWQAGDRVAAEQVATVAAVDAIFAVPVVPASARGCNQGGTDPTYCVYRTDAGELQLRINRAGDAGWVVTQAILGT